MPEGCRLKPSNFDWTLGRAVDHVRSKLRFQRRVACASVSRASTETVMELLKVPFQPGSEIGASRIRDRTPCLASDYDLLLVRGSLFS